MNINTLPMKMGTRLKQIIGDRLGAEIVEHNIEKAIVEAKGRADAPQSLFTDPFSLFLGSKWLPPHYVTGLNYRDMRGMAKNPIIGSIIQTRLNQVAMFAQPQRNDYEPGYAIMSDDPQAQEDKPRIRALVDWFNTAGLDGWGERSLEEFTRKFIRDSLTLDQACAEVIYRRNDLPAYFVAVDGATIRRLRASLDYPIAETEEPWYVQVLNERIVTEYREKDLLYAVRNPSTDVLTLGYGMSELEMLVRIVTTLLTSEKYNTSQLSSGGTQKGLLVVKGDANRQSFEQFKLDFREAIRNAADYWRPPVMQIAKDASVDWVELDRANRDMEYSQLFDFLVKQCCAIYSMVPDEINWQIGGSGTRINFEARKDAKIRESHQRGLRPLLTFYSSVLTHDIVKRIDPRYRLEFRGLNADKKADIEFRMQEVSSYKTVNEVRAEVGLSDLGPKGDVILSAQYNAPENPLDEDDIDEEEEMEDVEEANAKREMDLIGS